MSGELRVMEDNGENIATWPSREATVEDVVAWLVENGVGEEIEVDHDRPGPSLDDGNYLAIPLG